MPWIFVINICIYQYYIIVSCKLHQKCIYFTFLGPFVMNSDDEIQKTFRDYQLGKNGFENAPKWQSDYVKNRK